MKAWHAKHGLHGRMTCKACHAWSTCKSWHAWSTYVQHGMQAWSTCHGQHVKHGLHVHMTCKLWHAWSSITCLLGTHGVQRDVTHAHLDDNLHHHVLLRPRFVQAFMACSSQGCQLGVSLLTCTRWLNRLAMHEHAMQEHATQLQQKPCHFALLFAAVHPR